MGYSFRLTAMVLLYALSHRQDSTNHSLCYTSCGALAGTRNSSMGAVKDRSDDPSHHERTLLPRSYISLLNQQLPVYILPVPDPQTGCECLSPQLGGTGHLHLSASHTHPKSAAAVSRIPLQPPAHHFKMAQLSLVSRSTMSGRSQLTTATRLEPFSSSIVQAAPFESMIVPTACINIISKQIRMKGFSKPSYMLIEHLQHWPTMLDGGASIFDAWRKWNHRLFQWFCWRNSFYTNGILLNCNHLCFCPW